LPSTLWPDTVRPPSVEEVVRAARKRLAGRAFFDQKGSVGGQILLLEEEEREQAPYGVVLQERQPGGSLVAQPGLRDAIVIVRFECPAGWQGWDSWHYQHHAEASKALRGFTPDLNVSEPVASFKQHTYADTALYDEASDTRFSASSFHIKLRARA